MDEGDGERACADRYEAWRRKARSLLARGVPPEGADWGDGLFAASMPPVDADRRRPALRLSPHVVDVLQRAACHRDPAVPALMYRVLWRIAQGRRNLLDDAADDDAIVLLRMAKAVDRASHKMKAFVRFREIGTDDGPRFVARFEPEHDVLRRTAPFFVRRFASMDWTIATPDGVARWDRDALAFHPPAHGVPLPSDDAAEALWRAYYASIFNPARLNVRAMRREMPIAYWNALPEAACIGTLVSDARARATRMIDETLPDDAVGLRAAPPARPSPVDAGADTPSRAALDACTRCALGAKATQAVAGEGPGDARLMLVGEQPGDEEDLAGRPFVGPAGRLLRRALAEAWIDVANTYVTNAVKHFSYTPRGKRRIHKTPAQREVEACRGWLRAELAAVRPAVVVALGATALRALTGWRDGVGAARGSILAMPEGGGVIATWHPSAILRDEGDASRAERYRALVDDLRRAATLAATGDDAATRDVDASSGRR